MAMIASVLFFGFGLRSLAQTVSAPEPLPLELSFTSVEEIQGPVVITETEPRVWPLLFGVVPVSALEHQTLENHDSEDESDITEDNSVSWLLENVRLVGILEGIPASRAIFEIEGLSRILTEGDSIHDDIFLFQVTWGAAIFHAGATSYDMKLQNRPGVSSYRNAATTEDNADSNTIYLGISSAANFRDGVLIFDEVSSIIRDTRVNVPDDWDYSD
jgi:hypothetical protein